MPEIVMVQQMSGRRADGRFWPPVGAVIDVSAEEARELCAEYSQSSHPIAKYAEKRAEETGDAPAGEEKASDPRKAEDALAKAPRAAKPAPRPARGVETRD